MGMWIELGVFLLVFIFAFFQLKELKQEKLKREQKRQLEKEQLNSSETSNK
jgi:hypothetical protein